MYIAEKTFRISDALVVILFSRLKACLHLRSLIAMTTTTKTAAVKTTKTTITKAELKKTTFFLTQS